MKLCPGCDYLVPSSWDACERCGTPLERAGPLEPLATAAATRIGGARPDLDVPRRAMVAGDWDPMPAPRRVVRRESAWVTGDDPPRRRWRIPVIGPLAVVVAVASMMVAWQRFTNPPVPKALRRWAEHGAGVVLAPSGAGFRVRLPASPTIVGTQVTLGPGLQGSADVAMSRVGPYEVGAVWLPVASGTLDVAGSDPLTVAGDIAGRAANFRIEVPDTTHQNGLPALDAEVSHESQDGEALVVVHGTWIYAVVISGPGDLTAAFSDLRKVFAVT